MCSATVQTVTIGASVLLHICLRITISGRRNKMKNGKRPTRAQKMLMTKWHLNYNNWLVVKDTTTEMVVVHRDTGRTRTIQKG